MKIIKKKIKTEKLDSIKLVKQFYHISTPKEVASLCKASVDEAYNWLYKRGYSCVEIESKTFLTERQVEEFINSGWDNNKEILNDNN